MTQARRRIAMMLIRAAGQTGNSFVKVNPKNGKVVHKPPPLIFESLKQNAPAVASDGGLSMADSILKISGEYGPIAAWRRNEKHASDSLKAGWRQIMASEQQEEDLLIEEAEQLGLA